MTPLHQRLADMAKRYDRLVQDEIRRDVRDANDVRYGFLLDTFLLLSEAALVTQRVTNG
jgi:hypothetical protein